MKLLLKVYNGWCEWNSGKSDNAALLKVLVRAYEEAKNVAAESAWQAQKHQKVASAEAWLLANSASPTKDMNL